MTGAGRAEATPRRRRVLTALSLLRSALTATLLTVAYYVLPFDRGVETATALYLALGLLVVVLVIVWQIRVVIRSAHPRLRALEGVATFVPLLILLFATADFALGRDEAGAFSQPMNRTDALYFTMSVFSGVGFGDIVPRGQTARILTTVQMLVDLIVIGAVLRVLLGAVRIALHNRPGGTDPPLADEGPGDEG